MNQVSQIKSIVDELTEKGRIAAEDVLVLRRSVFPDGVVSAEEADAVFQLDHACAEKDEAWNQFYVDALTDYFLWQTKPSGYVDESLAEVLVDNITHDGKIDALSELALLINIVHWATECPEDLMMLALEAVRVSVLTPGEAAYGANRPENLITAGDVAIIRKVIHAPGGEGSITVTRAEAEMMFDLNEAVQGQETAPEWRDVFTKAIANHLMFPRPAPVMPSADEELRRQAWLKEPANVGNLLAGVGKAIGNGDIPFAEAWESVDPLGFERAKEEGAAEEARVREAFTREAIDAEEVAWLSDRILSDGLIDDNERAVLTFIRDNAPDIDEGLTDVFEQAGL